MPLPPLGVTRVLVESGYLKFARELDEDHRAFVLAHGTALHRAVELYEDDRLDLDTLDPTVASHFAGWIRLREQFPELVVLGTEIELAYPAPPAAPRLRGRADLRLAIGADRWVVDVKRSATPHPATAIQTALYGIALDATHPGEPHRRASLCLPATGVPKWTPYTDPGDYVRARNALAAVEWQRAKGLLDDAPPLPIAEW